MKNMMGLKQSFVCGVIIFVFVAQVQASGAAIPAFPGAEGYGSTTPGGRGGRVIEVTNLNDSGPGSLRAAVEADGPRTVVFGVSGTIALESDLEVRNPYLTIAGQTAPGDGICLRNRKLIIRTNDVIVRYLRIRVGREGDGDDALAIDEGSNVIVDHCSLSWGCDETLNTWHGSKNITVQWCIISEGLHHKQHGFAASLGGENASFHHLLIAHCPGRNPSIGGNNEHQTINMDFRNSVIYNFGHRTFDGKPNSVNIINNYFKPGPNSTIKVFARIDNAGIYEKIPTTAWYLSGNVWEGNEAITKDNAAGASGATQWLVKEPAPCAPVKTVSAEKAYAMVLDDVGATLPKRDSVDTRVIKDVRTGTATFGQGVVLHQDEVGGWPELKSAPVPVDTDKDGMPDTWEVRYGLDPEDAADGPRDKDGDGYTNLEEYLNGTDPTVYVDYTKPENNVNTLAAAPHPAVAVPDGYAAENGSTTGGGNAAPVVVTTADRFRELAGDETPRVIVVRGRIDLGSSVNIGSNKTIVGADTGSGLYGGRVNASGRNYIFQNLTMGPTAGDIMEISGGTNVFIHKCEFVDCTDESLSIVRGADFVTVSWCKFYFTEGHSHAFGHLIGNRTDRTSDRGKLHTTMHHNWYDAKVRSRMPRVRYGHVHLYNNFYNCTGNNYCVGVGHESHIRLENSHFENINQPWQYMDKGGPDNPSSGVIGWTGLKFVECAEPASIPNAFPAFTPPYEYKMDPVDEVKAIVTAGAGNVNVP